MRHFFNGAKLCRLVGRTSSDWRWSKRLLDGRFNRVSPLVHPRASTESQLLDADVGLHGHVGLHLAGAMAHAHPRLARHVCLAGGDVCDRYGGVGLASAPTPT